MPEHAVVPTSPRPNVAFDAHERAMTHPLFAVALLAFWGVYVAALWRVGYPGWRIALAMVPGMLLYTVPVAIFWRQLRHAGGVLSPPVHDALEHVSVLTNVLSCAVTGGLHSPLLFGVLFHPSRAIARRGWSGPAKLDLGLLLAGVAVMAVSPRAWLGPHVPEPTFSVLAFISIVFTLVFHADYFAGIVRRLESSRREAARAREALAAQALARARELEQFGAQLSHELKNPIGAIKTLVQLSARSATDAKARDRLGVIQGEVERMHGILQDYLSFSRPIEKLRLEWVDLGALADEVALVMNGRAEASGVRLSSRGGAEVNADPRRVKEALINLVANAIEASPSGGTVEIEVEAVDGFARLRVRDSGKGMPGEVLARLGTPFFTTREQGTGLGVVLARATFVHHGGGLRYESVEGQGTTATATIPLVPAQGERHGAATAR